ncbi:MAG: MarR family transcriptional regulator [Pseudomonadota bacterium]
MATDVEIARLLKAMRCIARALDVHSARIYRELGLTLPQLIVLSCVRDLGEVTGRAISRQAGLSPPTVVGILDKLAAKGLVERYRSAIDRRIVHARLTALGVGTLGEAPPLLGEPFLAGLARLDPAEREAMIAVCERIAAMQEVDAVHDSAALAEAPVAGRGPG